LFANAVAAVQHSYYDTAFVRTELPALVEEFRTAAEKAPDPAAERQVIWQLLSRIRGTHFALLSVNAYNALIGDLSDGGRVMTGMQLTNLQGRYFATGVLAGGPAEAAGVAEWDEVVIINGTAPAASTRLDWRSDDIALPDDRDPPVHELKPTYGDTLQLRIVRVPGETLAAPVVPAMYSPLRAARASARIITQDDVRVGYMHWWFMHPHGHAREFGAALSGPLQSSEVLLLDLRGRGGSQQAVKDVLDMLSPGERQRFAGPVVALIDGHTRSAKEELAYELRARALGRLVGEPTAGAFLAASFELIDHQTILMLPGKALPPYTGLIEGHPVSPDVLAPVPGPYAAGNDPLVAAGLNEAVRLVKERGPGFTRAPQ
jgi:carboxyl-terminal processing protease